MAAAAQATLVILGLTRFAEADTRANVGTFHSDGSANIIPALATINPAGPSGGGSDDAHLLICEVQEAGGLGTYIFVDASNPAPHPHRRFDVDEQVIVVAVDLLERLFRD